MSESHTQVLKRAGLVLLAFGALDIAYNVYTLFTAQTFKLGTSLLVIVAALLLMQGNLRVTRWITWLVALMLAWSVGSLLVVLPFTMPADLWLAQLRLNAATTVGGVFAQVVTAAVLFWLYRQLQRPSVLQARHDAGQSVGTPSSAFILGTLAAAFISVAMLTAQYSESGGKALRLAQEQAGSGYRYHVASLNWSGKGMKADVTAFNDREIKSVRVEWPN